MIYFYLIFTKAFHFPSVDKHLKKILSSGTKIDKLVGELCALIESRLGRSMPMILSKRVYNANPSSYNRKAKDGEHFNEATSSSLLILMMQKIRAFKKRPRERSRSKSPKRKIRLRSDSRESHQSKASKHQKTSPAR